MLIFVNVFSLRRHFSQNYVVLREREQVTRNSESEHFSASENMA